MVSDAQATYLIKLMAQEDVSRVMRQMGVTSVNELTRVDRVLDGTRKEISGTAASAALLGKRLEESGTGARRAAVGADLYADALDEVGDEARQATLQLTRLDARGTRAFNRLRRAAGGFGRSIGRVVTSPLTQLTALLGTFAGVQGFRAITRDAADFQRVMAEVATILPDAAGGIEGLSRQVLDLSIQQNQLETDTGRGLYQVISAGITDASEALLVLGQSGQLAVGGVAAIDKSVDLLTTTLNAYHRAASESEQISDDYFATVREGKTTISELAASIGDVLPGANSLNVSLKQNNAALATLTQGGNNTAKSATLLKALYTSLIREADKLDEVLQRNGKSYDLNTIRQRGFLEVLRDVRAATRDDSEALEVLGGNVEAFNALLGLTGENLPTFLRITEALKDTAGSTKEAVETIAGTDLFRVEQAFGAVRKEAQALGNAVLKGTADVIEGLGGIEGVQRRVQALFEQLSPSIEEATEDVLEFFTSFVDRTSDIELATLQMQDYGDSIGSAARKLADLLTLQGTRDSRLESGLSFARDNGQLLSAVEGAYPGPLRALGARQSQLLEEAGRLREQIAELRSLARTDLIEAVTGTGPTAEEQQRALEQIAELEGRINARAGEREDLKRRISQLAQDELRVLERQRAVEEETERRRRAAQEARARRMLELREQQFFGEPQGRDEGDGRFLGALRDQAGQLGDFLTDNIDPAVARQNALVLALTGRWGEAVATLGTAEPELVDLNRLTGMLGEEWAKVLARMREAPDAVQQTAEQEREFRSLLLGIDAQVARSDAEKLDVLQRQLALQAELATTKAEELGASDEELALLRQRLELLRELQLGEFGKKPGEKTDDGGTPGEGGPDALEQLRKQRELNLQVTSIQAQIEGAAETATGALFEDFIIGAKSAKDAFRDFAEEVVRQLVRIAAQAAASSLFQAVFGVAAGVATGGLAGVGVAAAGTAASQPVENAKGGITPAIGPPIPVHFYASGGVGGVARGTQAAIFGEGKNFEAYVPLPDNQRIPVQLTGAQGVSLSVSVNMPVQTLDAGSFRDQLPRYSKEIGEAVGRAVRNNPHVRATIRGLGSGRG